MTTKMGLNYQDTGNKTQQGSGTREKGSANSSFAGNE